MSVEVEVTFDDLTEDAQDWRSSGGRLRSLAGSTASRDLPNSAFMMAGYGFAQVYRRFLTKFGAHLGAGADESDAVAAVLSNAVAGYHDAEQKIISDVRAISAEIEG